MDENNIFIIDIPKCNINQEVEIIGIVISKKDFQNAFCGFKIKDITGNVFCLIDTKNEVELKFYKNINVNSRIKIYGSITENSKKIRVISSIKKIDVLGTLKSELSLLDTELREQASRMLMSRICRRVSKILQDNRFAEFESKLISNRWYEESLEPLQVVYPGFGSPAFLIISPAAQIIDFMTTTIVSRAFTVSSSFTSSYRFKNGSAETKVIIAKSIDLSFEELELLLTDITYKILNEVNMNNIAMKKYYGEWPDIIDNEKYYEKQLIDDLNIIEFKTNIPVIGKNWNSNIDVILQIVDREKNILAECSKEKIGNNMIINSLIIYPAQFLGLIEKAPIRNLMNLTKIFDGKN